MRHRVSRPSVNRHRALAIAPYNVYPTAAGHGAIFTALERHWHSVARVPDREDLPANPDFASIRARAARGEEIDAIAAAWTRRRGKEEVLMLLRVAHVPFAPVRTTREVVNDPHLTQRGVWIDVEHRRRGKRRVPNSPIRLHGSAPAAVDRPAPCRARTLTGYCRSPWACARTSWPHCTRRA